MRWAHQTTTDKGRLTHKCNPKIPTQANLYPSLPSFMNQPIKIIDSNQSKKRKKKKHDQSISLTKPQSINDVDSYKKAIVFFFTNKTLIRRRRQLAKVRTNPAKTQPLTYFFAPEISTSDKKIIKALPKNRIPETKIKPTSTHPFLSPWTNQLR